jgi:hypothetical protein|tara:strand:+ start:50 stop:277 length:228 start_codon:yes stop_codon:yes gene_type:complete
MSSWLVNKAMIYKNHNIDDLAIETLKLYLEEFSNDSEANLELGKLLILISKNLMAIERLLKFSDNAKSPSPKTIF